MVRLIILTVCLLTLNFRSCAQYTKLLDFDDTNGSLPLGAPVSDGTFLYGMTEDGGVEGDGTLYKIKTDGTGYVKLLDFDGAVYGRYPNGALILVSSTLYGMTTGGGANGLGTVFKILPDGTGYTRLLDFNGAANGQNPVGSLLSDGTFLYGMTSTGGTNNMGTIFKIMPDGSGYVKLLDFDGAGNGRTPRSTPISDGTFLYGMTDQGGTNDMGVVFKIMPDGTGYVKLLDFAGTSNGADPEGSLLYDGTFLYGMTEDGGVNNLGAIFRIKPDGTSYAKILDFTGANGRVPEGPLVSDGTFLYGVTGLGGGSNFGIVFKILPDGSGYEKLLDFDGTATGRFPGSGPAYNGTFLYGTTSAGGANDLGVVYKYSTVPSTGPTITSFTPASGPVGTSVTITGTNFSTTPANNTVRFNGMLATVINSSATTINTTVPAGATTGTITVTVAGNTATSATSFTVTTGTSNQPPVIATSTTAARVGGIVTIDLLPLISDADNNLDLSTLSLVTNLSEQGASAVITSSSELILDYEALEFYGTDHVTLEVCDLLASCAQQELTIEVTGDIVVYNAISPNGDLLNASWQIRNIELFTETRNNNVTVYDRWGDKVFSATNYDNTSRVFKGLADSGGELPSGTYFYRIEFMSGRPSKTGYLVLKR